MTRSNLPARLHCVFALLLTCAFALVFASVTNAATDTPQPPPAAAQTIETDLATLKTLADQTYQNAVNELVKMPSNQRRKFWGEHCRAINDKAFAIYDAYKNDPRHWEAVSYLRRGGLEIYGAKEDPALIKIVPDPIEAKEYDSRLAKIDADMDAATDVPADVREERASQILYGKLNNAEEAIGKKQTPAPDLTALRAAVDTFLADWPDSRYGVDICQSYLRLEKQLPGTSEAEILKTFAQSPNPAVGHYAKQRLAYWDRFSKPVEMTFTAADGREVDLAKLRGKVVIIDFWATWCGPCKADIPNMKALYSKYHDKGLEIIGIALEDAKLAPKKDSPEQTEKKLADAKKALLDFIEKEQMPWPQYFDGKYWKNEYTSQYYIAGVPTKFILGKDGVIALKSGGGSDESANETEEKVKQLLGL